MESGDIYSSMGPGMLGLEMSLHHHIPQQHPHHHMQQQQQQQHQNPVVSYGHHDGDNNQQPPMMRQGFPYGGNKPKNQSLTFSDDDEPGPGVSAENSVDDGTKRKMCPWQRMKWTDNMVRLLIVVVYYIGDEVGSEGNDPSGKKKTGSGSGVLQKKGKWKSVSRAMMERGFYVSPQQCEDKFNDLNKRYKRVNDILGKGTACRVVENQSLLESMDLSPKMKEEVKKLLNSKHLFFREMCAYHNSCGHGTGGGTTNRSPEAAVEASAANNQHQLDHNSSENAKNGANLGRGELKLTKGTSGDDENDDDDDDEDEDGDDEVSKGGHDCNHHSQDEDADMDERSRKRPRKVGLFSPMVQQLNTELVNVFQDGGKSQFEKRKWLKARMIQLEEQHVSYQCQAFELEKQRLKWERFSSKKEREMERDKLNNERKKLENERMVLMLKQKEVELLDVHRRQQQQQVNYNRSSDHHPSSVTG